MLLQLNNFFLEIEKVSNLYSDNYNEYFPESLKLRIDLKKNREARVQSVAAYSLLSEVLNREYNLSLKELCFTDNGKPYLKNGPFISLSHSGEYVCVGVSKNPIGVDIEKIREFNSSILERYFSKTEKRYILKKNIKERFFTLWTLKEAILKKQGITLSDLSRIRLIIIGKRFFYKNFKLISKIYENHVISVCFDEKTGI